MTAIDIDIVLAALDPEGRGGRRQVDDVAAAVRSLAPHLDADELPALILETVRRGEELGCWTAARTVTVRRGRTTLPKSVTLPATTRPVDKLFPIRVPLRSELSSWAAKLQLSASQRDLLIAVNEWLRRTDGGKVPIAQAAERAYELTGDEKAFDSSPPRGGAKLWAPGRLSFELLRCERTPTPLVWEPTTTLIGPPGPMVCVENHATFRTLAHLIRAQTSPPWIAVAWVQGRNTAPLQSLPDLPFTVTRLDYLGDLDPAGLAIAAHACGSSLRAGVPAGPAEKLWHLLAQQPSRPARAIRDAEASRLAAWLPESVRDAAQRLLTTGRAVPQEALRYELLADSL